WDFDNNGSIDSKLQNPTHTFPNAGTFDVRLTIKQGPCDSTIVKKVTVAPLPVLNITNPAEVCLPTKVDITAASVTTGSTGGGTLTYWTDAAATVPLSNPGAVGVSGTYYIKTTTAAGCTDIKPVVVTINPGADLVITDPPAVCTPGTVDITAAAVTAGSVNAGTLTYWSDQNGMVSVSNPTAIAVSGTYYIKGTPATGCTDIKPVKVVISPLPILSITTPAPVCMPGTVDLTAPAVTAGSSSGGTYTYWKDAAATIILPSPNAVAASGTYYIKIVVAGGCSTIQPVNVTINPLPISYAGPDVVICTGDNAALGTTTTANYSYSWSPATGLSNANISNPTVSLTNLGKVPVSSDYIVTTTNTLTNCVSRDTVKVTVNSVPTVNAGSAASVCPGSKVNLKGSIGRSATSAVWSGGAGIFGNRNDLETTYTPTEAEFMAGTVTLTLTSDDPAGPCTFASSDLVLTFYKNPTIKFAADDKEGCPTHCVQFSDSSFVIGSSDFVEKWNWNFGDQYSSSNTSEDKNPKHCYDSTGYYDVKLTVFSNHGCHSTQTVSQMIHVFAIPVAEFTPTPNPASVLDPTVTLVNGSSPDVVYWNYHFGDGDSVSPITSSPVHLYPDKASTSYLATLTVRNADGCVNYVEHLVEIGPEFTFYIPNAFTPDGDGVNDFFFGKGIGIVKYDFVIFDRWGNLIFHSENLEDQWNGKANNGDEIAQQDVFVWKVKLTDVFGKKHSYMGHVTLVK
ncbi:MAG TPA: PKD domain-containing protein, partial [Bacteroidia bacterium]|nr:PKD domain-containing protein [Bacteroidia bacterium]